MLVMSRQPGKGRGGESPRPGSINAKEKSKEKKEKEKTVLASAHPLSPCFSVSYSALATSGTWKKAP